MTLWQQIVYIVRAMPSFYADRMDKWLADQHIPADGRGPCPVDGEPSPCRTYMEARERIYARR